MKVRKTKYYINPRWNTYLKVSPTKVYFYHNVYGCWKFICYTADLFLPSDIEEISAEQVFIDIL